MGQPWPEQDCLEDAVLCHLPVGNLFSRELDELPTETHQEAFPQEYTRNVNNQESLPHSPGDILLGNSIPPSPQ